jgi:NifU-like protein involved in Fe-S cluster formation
MAGAAALYTPEVLALAASLANVPLDDSFAIAGDARAPLCGSALRIGLDLDAAGKVTRIGLRVHACAIGQAAAAIFSGAAIGIDRSAIAQVEADLRGWLGDGGALPDWPGLSAIAAAAAYPARHGAILLPWKAALAALPSS